MLLLTVACQTTPTVTPAQEAAWKARQLENQKAAAAAHATDLETRCGEASAATRTSTQERVCGDDLDKDKRRPEALARWRAAIAKAQEKREQYRPHVKKGAYRRAVER